MVAKKVPMETSGVFENVLIRASAGTGKTFQLSNRYLNLLASGVDVQEILATTFTKKGAGEILDRIIQRLSRAALSPICASGLADELGIPLDQGRARSILQKLLRNLHRLEISTLDSFFNRVARVFSLELGLPPSWEIVEEQQIDMLRRRTIHGMLQNKDVVSLLPLMVKGDSSRKIATLVMDTVNRMYDVRRESAPDAWDRLEEVKSFLPEAQLTEIIDRAVSVTFDKGKQIPKHWDTVKPLFENENWSELAEAKSLQNVLAGNFKYGSAKLPPEIVTIIEAIIPHCRAWITHRLIQQNRSTCALLGLYGESMEVIKSELGQLRFDDVTERLVEFMSMWDTDQFSFRLDHQIRHLLLDEFQDTSPTQWNVVEPFAKAVCHSNDPLRSLFCVGDMKQAIFGWRGGVAEIFDLVERKLDGLDASQPLTTSYRSSQQVIDFVNDVFLKLDQYKSDSDVVNHAVHSWGQWFSTHSTARDDIQGHVTIEYAAEVSDEIKRDSKGDSRVVRERNRNLNRAAVDRVQQLNSSLPPGKTIGVLVRTNREVGELIFMLQDIGIRASEEGGNPLTDSAAVELVLSSLWLADHPGDSIARFHVSYSPLAQLFDLHPETTENQSENRESVLSGAANLRNRLVQDGYGPTIESLARMLAPQCTKREIIRLQHLVRLSYASRSDSQRWSMRPSRFVDYVRNEVKIADASSARVRVMTIHKSKGLEFDSVVLPMPYQKNGWLGMTPPLIVGRPSATEPIETVCRYVNANHRKLLPAEIQEVFEADQERSVRESMCVLYVALTRAVHSLHVVMSYSHMPHDKSSVGVMLPMLCPTVVKKSDRCEGVIYESGEPTWFQNLPEQPADNDSGIDRQSVKQYYSDGVDQKPVRPLSRTAKSMRGLSRIQPSMLEGGNRVVLAETLTSPDLEQTREFGRLMHACFEQVCWLDQDAPVSDLRLQEALQKLSPGSSQINAVISRFRMLLEKDNLYNLLSSASVLEQFVVPDLEITNDKSCPNRVEVHTEKRLAALLESQQQSESTPDALVEGILDRLVLVFENGNAVAAEIIDFKVDQIDDSNLTDRISHYRPQLAAYQAAVAQNYQLSVDRIASRLVFVQTGQVIQVDALDHVVDQDTDLKLPTKKKPTSGSGKLKPKKPKSALKKKKASSEIQQTLWGDVLE